MKYLMAALSSLFAEIVTAVSPCSHQSQSPLTHSVSFFQASRIHIQWHASSKAELACLLDLATLHLMNKGLTLPNAIASTIYILSVTFYTLSPLFLLAAICTKLFNSSGASSLPITTSTIQNPLPAATSSSASTSNNWPQFSALLVTTG